MTNKNWIVVGQFGRPQGLNGFVRVFSFTEPKDNLYKYNNWHAQINHALQKIEPLDLQKHSKFDLVKIVGFESRDGVASLTNVKIVIEKTQLPPLVENEYYWHQLLGMSVTNKQGVALGTVQDMLATGANDVMIVEGVKRYLIPFIYNDFVVKIDNNIITVDWDAEF